MERLSTDQLCKLYRGRAVVNGVSISMARGEVVGLLGPNGAGKTTTFHMIVGQIAPDIGRVLLDEHDITSLPMYQRAELGISYLPQEPSIFRKLSVEQNLMAILEVQPLSGTQRKERLEKLLEMLGLGKVRRTLGYALSGGERRRVEIARCLCIEPNFILLDEPFSGID
ncbi:MAG: LPS export ABC transporter ATP-binding protein, partial [bacterium]